MNWRFQFSSMWFLYVNTVCIGSMCLVSFSTSFASCRSDLLVFFCFYHIYSIVILILDIFLEGDILLFVFGSSLWYVCVITFSVPGFIFIVIICLYYACSCLLDYIYSGCFVLNHVLCPAYFIRCGSYGQYFILESYSEFLLLFPVLPQLRSQVRWLSGFFIHTILIFIFKKYLTYT